LFVIFWLIGFINAVNWLDGMDGLAGGVGAVASLTMFLLATSALVNQPPLAVMAIALCGALVGFLAFNGYPARIYMGTSGAYFLGFLLAVLAIFAGGKIATAFLVMGFPLLDAFWVIVERLRRGSSPFVGGDRSHLQYNLLDRGWSERRVVFFICLLSALFGAVALYFQGLAKFIALIILYAAVSVWMTKIKAGKKVLRQGEMLTK
jgi:UDP-GlcNAc:undecaprenyl-phosphate GlcNAc-1-phosphate transferase